MVVFLLLLSLYSFTSCLKEQTTTLDIEIQILYSNNIVGKKGTVLLYSRQEYMDIQDTRKNTCFETTITNTLQQSYVVKCGLWRVNSLLFFCNIDENIPQGEWSLNLNNKSFNYNEYTINLIANPLLTFNKKDDLNIVDLYSDKQIINLDDGKESYDLQFKIVSYNNEKLIINGNTVLDNCKQKKDELICTITKSKIISIIGPEDLDLRVSCLDNYYEIKTFYLVPKIDIIYNNIKKKNINVLITKLIKNVVEDKTYVTYQTNVTDIENIFVEMNSIEFEELTFTNNEREKKAGCFFRKYDNYPLLILCRPEMGNEYWLKEITKDLIIENQNINYNFIIKPVNIPDKVNRDGYGSEINWFIPEVLDFTKKDSLTVTFYAEHLQKLTAITFNENEKDLDCEDLGSSIRKCIVPKSHFKDKTNGYYFIKYQNHLNYKSIAYEVPPIKVVLSSESNSHSYLNIRINSLFILLLFLIIF